MAFERIGLELIAQNASQYVSQLRQAEAAEKGVGNAAAHAAQQMNVGWGSAFKIGAALAGVNLGLQFGMRATVTAMRGFANETIGAAIAFEDSFAGIRKTMDATEAEFEELMVLNRQLARELPSSVNEINRIGELAGQLGVRGVDNIAKFEETIAKLTLTTNVMAEEGALALAQIANVTKLPQDQIDRLGSSLVELGNNFATTEHKILNFTQRIAGAGSVVGLTVAEIAGIGAAVASTGEDAEAGGTAIQKTLLEIQAAVVTGGGNLETFAATAGMSAQAFTEAWKSDPAKAFDAFIQGLNSQGQEALLTLEDLGFTEVRLTRVLLKLAQGGDTLTDAIDSSTRAFAENNALNVEAEKRIQTTASQMALLRNNIADVGITIGAQTLPMINSLITGLIGFLQSIEPITGQLHELRSIVVGVTAALVILGVTFAAIKLQAFTVALLQTITVMRQFGVQAALMMVTGRTLGTGLSAALASPIPAVLALITVITTLDFALQHLTGNGLFDWLTGNTDETDKLSEATARYGTILENINQLVAEGADSGVARQTEMISFAEDLSAALENVQRAFEEIAATESVGGPFEESADINARQAAYDEEADAIRHLFNEIMSLNPTYEELLKLMETVPNLAAYGPFNDALEDAKDAAEEAAEAMGFKSVADMEAADNAIAAAEEQKKAAEMIKKATEDILPSVTTTYAKWRTELQQQVLAHQTFASNLAFIKAALVSGEVKNIDAIMAVLEEKGPLYTARFAYLFAANPAEAIALFGELAPLIAQEGMAGVGAGFEAAAPSVIATAASIGARAARAFNEAFAKGEVQGPPVPGSWFKEHAAGAAGLGIDWEAEGNRIRRELAALFRESRSSDTPTGGGGGGGGGGASAIETEIEKAKTALDGFMNSLAEFNEMTDFEKQFGDLGATVAKAMTDAFEQGTEESGSAAFASITDLIDEAKEKGVPNAEALGKAVIDAMVAALNGGSGDMALAAVGALQVFTDAIAAVVPQTVGEAFAEAFDANIARDAMEADIGEIGADVMDALTDAIAEKTPEAGVALADAVDNVIDDAREAGVENVDEFADDLSEALATAIAEGTPEAIAAVFQMMNDIADAIEEAGEEPIATAETVAAAIAAALADLDLEEVAGNAAVDLVNAIDDALQDGVVTLEEGDAIGQIVAGIIDELGDIAGPAAAAEYGEALIAALQAVLAGGGPEAMAALVEILTGIKDTIDDAEAAIEAEKEAAAAAEKAAKEAAQAAEQAARDAERAAEEAERERERARQDALRELNDFGNLIMKALKKQYAEQEKAQLEALKTQFDALEDWKEKELKIRLAPYKAELEAIEEIEDAQKKGDLERRLAESYDVKERYDLIQQINQFLLDEQKEAIKKEMDLVEDEVDEEYETRKAALEKQEDLIKQYYDNITDEYAIQAEARLLIEQNNLDAIMALFTKYEPQWMEAGRTLAEQLTEGMRTGGWGEEIQRLFDIIDGGGAAGPNAGGGSGSGSGAGGGTPPYANNPRPPANASGPPIPPAGFYAKKGPDGRWYFIPQWMPTREIDEWNRGEGLPPGAYPALNGLGYVPYDNFLLSAHKGEGVLTAEENSLLHRVLPALAMAAGGSGVGGGSAASTLTIDLSGSTFNGTPEENAGAFERSVKRIIREEAKVDAFFDGIRVHR